MKMSIKQIGIVAAGALLLVSATSCSRLSSRGKEIVGQYYIPELSEDVPLMDLRKNATCTMTAVRPGVITFSVEGKWNVIEGDTLVMELDPTQVVVEGDSSLVGKIPATVKRAIVDFNGINLTLRDGSGLSYVYHRRAETAK